MKTAEERFWVKVKKTRGCWLWRSTKGASNRGMFWYEKRRQLAYRVSYQWAKGPIPDGLILDHLCRNPACVNPDHLEPVTYRENALRGIGACATNARKTHCINGHLLKGENIYPRANGYRVCRVCAAEKSQEISELLGPSRDKTKCINGHKYTPANTRILVSGARACRICKRLSDARCKNGNKRDKSQCRHGHTYTEDTIYINCRGVTECAVCRRERDQLRYERIQELTI